MTVAERIDGAERPGLRTGAQQRGPDWTNIEEQLRSMTECGDPAERRRRRQHIITESLTLADHIAQRFAGRGEPSDDLVQVARIGLVKSVDRYVPGKGRFMAFAVPTIRGEVRRHFRDSTWSMRVPRKIQETQLRMRHTVNELSQRLSRPPTDSEVARELGVDHDEVSQCHSAHWAYQPVSLDAPRGDNKDGGTSIGESRGAHDPGFDSVEDLIVLREVIAELDPRRRAILGMRFFDCLTQREIALRLNISQVQVSRLLDGTLARLRQRMYTDVPVVLCAFASVVGTF
jgi:RNA polymerase sigma-B factor